MFHVTFFAININNRIVNSSFSFDTEEKESEFEFACLASLENFFIRVYDNEKFFCEISKGKFIDDNFKNFFINNK